MILSLAESPRIHPALVIRAALGNSLPTTTSFPIGTETMEALPTELKLLIIDKIRDLSTLSTLVHASPMFHRVYAARRSDIFTQVTVRVLQSQGICFTVPISWAEVCFERPLAACQPLRQTLMIINHHLMTKSDSPMVLTIEQCKSLLNIVHVNVYVDAQSMYQFPSWNRCKSMPAYPYSNAPAIKRMIGPRIIKESSTYPCGVHRYYVLILADYTTEECHSIARVMKKLQDAEDFQQD